MLKVQVSLWELRSFIDKVPDYPISAEELVDLAIAKGADAEIIEFYRAFGRETFTSKEDLLARSEQVEILHEEEERQPQELWSAPEED